MSDIMEDDRPAKNKMRGGVDMGPKKRGRREAIQGRGSEAYEDYLRGGGNEISLYICL